MFELSDPEPADVASPCVKTCTLDRVTGWCLGCGRSMAEIAGWGDRPHVDRRAILTELPARMAALDKRRTSPR